MVRSSCNRNFSFTPFKFDPIRLLLLSYDHCHKKPCLLLSNVILLHIHLWIELLPAVFHKGTFFEHVFLSGLQDVLVISAIKSTFSYILQKANSHFRSCICHQPLYWLLCAPIIKQFSNTEPICLLMLFGSLQNKGFRCYSKKKKKTLYLSIFSL